MNDAAWRVSIINEPTDPMHCLGYADWLEEQGRNSAAFAMRWMAKYDRRPAQRTHYRPTANEMRIGANLRRVPEAYRWGWCLCLFSGNDTAFVTESCELPVSVFREIAKEKHRVAIYYTYWEDAVKELAEGLGRLHDVLKI